MLFSRSVIFLFFFTIMLNHLARFSNTKLNRRFLILFYSILGLSFLKLDIQLGNSSLHYMYYFSTVLCTIMNSDIQLCNSSYLLTKKTLHSCMYVLGLKNFETGLLTVQWEYTILAIYVIVPKMIFQENKNKQILFSHFFIISLQKTFPYFFKD